MYIEKLQVEEGFLDGLNLTFEPGLNVLIGARGTGKTSVIELLRFALDARSHTPETGRRSLEHARSILESGQVTATLNENGQTTSVVRSSNEEKPRSDHAFRPPIVFSQTEIETIGLHEAGRLNLVDSFLAPQSTLDAEGSLQSQVRSVIKEMRSVSAEIDTISVDVDGLVGLRSQLAETEAKAKEATQTSAAIAPKADELTALSDRMSAIAVELDTLERFQTRVGRWVANLEQLLLDEDVAALIGDGPSFESLASHQRDHEAAVQSVRAAYQRFQQLLSGLQSRKSELERSLVQAETKARDLRAEIENVQQGAGVVARQLSEVRTQIARLSAMQSVLADRRARFEGLRSKREALLDQLDAVREKRFEARRDVVHSINDALRPRIHLAMERAAQYDKYHSALVDALRGTGIKYADLIDLISQNLSPRALVRAVDDSNYEYVAVECGISKDRAARVVNAIKDSGVEEIATCLVEDGVNMLLLDGAEYKDVSALSAGQRCTVILPIVLLHRDRVLVIDQPEDHIDNAFIVDTLIKALKGRTRDQQIIVSTHNANIPVLGDANMVIEMDSDGRNGFVKTCGPLNSALIVASITNVMEGGRDAFQARANFYAANDR